MKYLNVELDRESTNGYVIENVEGVEVDQYALKVNHWDEEYGFNKTTSFPLSDVIFWEEWNDED
jgi:hypothetical protein